LRKYVKPVGCRLIVLCNGHKLEAELEHEVRLDGVQVVEGLKTYNIKLCLIKQLLVDKEWRYLLWKNKPLLLNED
jgi:hypothetical protein